MRRVRISAGGAAVTATVRETPTAEAMLAALPIQATVRTWGDEIYFQTPVDIPTEPDAHDIVEAGEIAFWPAGNCIAIGFGPTPMSRGTEIRLASPVNVWADSDDDVRCFAATRDGDEASVERLD